MQLPCCVEEEQKTPSLESLLQETALFLWKDWPRDMLAVTLDANTGFSLRGACPHCRENSVFMQVTSVFTMLYRITAQGTMNRLIVGMRCQGCLQYILAVVLHIGGQPNYAYEMHYPLGLPDDRVADEIPDSIKPDFKEALRCRFVDAYNATAEMCRRSLEASCIDLGASPKDALEDMIDELADKRIITPFLQQVAHKIRLGGNRGAHPSSLIITQEHADAIIKFTREFFHHVYVVPRELNKYDFSKPKELKP